MPAAKPQKKRMNLTKKADAIFGKIIRAPGWCINCGSTEVIQCAHGFSRSYRAVRWDDRNAFPLCRGCHVKYTHRPLEWDEWLRHWWGDQTYSDVRALALTHVRPDLDALVVELRERVKVEVTA